MTLIFILCGIIGVVDIWLAVQVVRAHFKFMAALRKRDH